MTNFPIFLKLENRPCLVVGGGRVAARKIKQLLQNMVYQAIFYIVKNV